MKKQKQLILYLFFGVCLTAFAPFQTIQFGEYTTGQEIQKSDSIDLEGDLKTKGGSIRSATDPIVAELQDDMLFVHFLANAGVLQVSVTGERREVYAATVDTAVQPTMSISLAGVPAGRYTLTFSNESGMMWGAFEL